MQADSNVVVMGEDIHWGGNFGQFNGLYDDADPLVGTSAAHGGTFTVQARPVRHRIVGLPQFVVVRGGAYFFLPGIQALRAMAS